MEDHREVIIFVGAGLSPEEIEDALHDSDSGKGQTLLNGVAASFLACKFDERVEVGDVSIDAVSVNSSFPNQLHIQISVDWSIYIGCRDMDSAGTEVEDLSATYASDGNLIFLVPNPTRAPSDC